MLQDKMQNQAISLQQSVNFKHFSKAATRISLTCSRLRQIPAVLRQQASSVTHCILAEYVSPHLADTSEWLVSENNSIEPALEFG